MRKQMKRIPKNLDFGLSMEILKLFKKKGGVYAVAKRNNRQCTNLYSQIYRCSNALGRIRKLLQLVNHDLKYEIVDLKSAKDQK
jgi:hypothetical protein